MKQNLYEVRLFLNTEQAELTKRFAHRLQYYALTCVFTAYRGENFLGPVHCHVFALVMHRVW